MYEEMMMCDAGEQEWWEHDEEQRWREQEEEFWRQQELEHEEMLSIIVAGIVKLGFCHE